MYMYICVIIEYSEFYINYIFYIRVTFFLEKTVKTSIFYIYNEKRFC